MSSGCGESLWGVVVGVDVEYDGAGVVVVVVACVVAWFGVAGGGGEQVVCVCGVVGSGCGSQWDCCGQTGLCTW